MIEAPIRKLSALTVRVPLPLSVIIKRIALNKVNMIPARIAMTTIFILAIP